MDERLRQIVDGALMAGIETGAAIDVQSDLLYGDDPVQRFDVYAERGEPAAHRPAWVFVHGGPLPPPLRALRDPRTWRFFRDYGTLAAACGRVGVVLGHRYPSIDALADSEADLRAGLDRLRERADELGLDPERISLWLFSGAGVHLRALLARPPAGVGSVIAFYPVVTREAVAAVVGADLAPEAENSASSLGSGVRRLFVARAGLDHPALNAALDALAAELLATPLELEIATHPRGRHGFELLDDDARTREVVESALRFLVRGESEHEPLPRVVRPALAAV